MEKNESLPKWLIEDCNQQRSNKGCHWSQCFDKGPYLLIYLLTYSYLSVYPSCSCIGFVLDISKKQFCYVFTLTRHTYILQKIYLCCVDKHTYAKLCVSPVKVCCACGEVLVLRSMSQVL